MEFAKGQIVTVTRTLAGSSLVVDASSSDTVLFLDDVSDFNDDGGQVTVDGVVYDYDPLMVDRDAQTVTLSAGLAGAEPAFETFVAVYPEAPTHAAEVLLTDNSGVTVPARVPHWARDLLREGPRDPDMRESVDLLDVGGEWLMLDIEFRNGERDATTTPIIVSTEAGESVRIDGDGISTYTNDPVPIRTIGGGASSVASDGTYVFAGDLVSVTAFDIATGDVVWTIAVGVTDLSYESGFVYVAAVTGGDIRKYDAATGAENLSGFPITASGYGYLAVDGGFIYARETSTADIRKFDSTTGAENTSGFPITGTFNDLAASDGFIFTDSGASSLKKYDATTGVEDTGGDFPIAGNFGAVGAYGGYVYACDLAADTVRKFDDGDGIEVVTGGFPIAIEFDANYWSLAVNVAVLCVIDTSLNVRVFNNADGFQSTGRDSSDGSDRVHNIHASDIQADGNVTIDGNATVPVLSVADDFTLDTFDVSGPWTDYTPTWTGSGSNPTAANHTIVGRYMRIGKTIHFSARVSCGASGFGGGNYSLSLPVAQSSTWFTLINGNLYDSSTGSLYRAGGIISASGSTALLVIDPTTAGNPLRTVTPTVPFTFANADQIHIWGTYEAA